MILDSRFWILDCGLKQHESHCRKRLRGERGSSSIAFMRGSGRGHAFSDTWETWMVAKVLNPVPRKRGGWGDQIKIRIKGSARGHPLSGARKGPPALLHLGNVDGPQCDCAWEVTGGSM